MQNMHTTYISSFWGNPAFYAASWPPFEIFWTGEESWKLTRPLQIHHNTNKRKKQQKFACYTLSHRTNTISQRFVCFFYSHRRHRRNSLNSKAKQHVEVWKHSLVASFVENSKSQQLSRTYHETDETSNRKQTQRPRFFIGWCVFVYKTIAL